MIDKTDFILYGGVVVAVLLGAFLVYRILKRKKEKPNSVVMNKISDFYATQDQKHNY